MPKVSVACYTIKRTTGCNRYAYLFRFVGLFPYTIDSKINGTAKGFYVPISKLHSILAIKNLNAHNNITKSYFVHVNSLRLKLSVASKWASKHLWEHHLFCC